MKSGFMGGLYVFPGGTVDNADAGIDAWSPYVDLTPEQIEHQLGDSTLLKEDALGFGIAAIRETLEESGVLMASGVGKTPKDFEDICTCRLQKDLPKSWFKTRIMEEKWTLSLSSLGRWSHLITPKLMKKRYDTRFFIALMPENQTCVPDNMETQDGFWLTPQSALEKNLDKKIPLSPPTVLTLTQMLKFKTFDALEQEFKNRVWGAPIAPRLVPSTKGPVILQPWDPQYESDCTIETPGLSNKVLPPGAWFSRIWCDKGIWKPVSE